jgi:anti-sigma factor (TIGR02949 family)
MTCQEALSLLYDVIDKEASEIDVQQVQEHLANCRHCSEIYQVEEAVNALLREKLRNQKSPTQMEALKHKVLAQLDAIDIEETACSCSLSHDSKKNSASQANAGLLKTEPLFKLNRLIAVAAAVVVVIGAGYVGMTFMQHEHDFRAIEDAHFYSVAHLDELPDAIPAAAQVSSQIGYELAPAVAGFELVGGHVDTVDSIEMFHFVYRNHDRTVSVFVARAEQYRIPDSILHNPVMKHHLEFYLHHCRGCNVALHRAGNAVIVTATEDHEVQLVDFVPGQGTI